MQHGAGIDPGQPVMRQVVFALNKTPEVAGLHAREINQRPQLPERFALGGEVTSCKQLVFTH
jgi:hypothetical protein